MPPFTAARRRVVTRVLIIGAIPALAVFALATRGTAALLAATVASGALISVLSVEVVAPRRRLAGVQRSLKRGDGRSASLKPLASR